MTVCNMSIEAGARAGLIAPDETTFAYLRGPAARAAGRRLGAPRSSTGARCAPTTTPSSTTRSSLDAAALTPFVTWGTNPGQGAAARRRRCPTRTTSPTPADAGRRRARADLHGPARRAPRCATSPSTRCSSARAPTAGSRTCGPPPTVLRGRQVADGVRMLVVPGSMAGQGAGRGGGARRGLHRRRAPSGASAGCSMCLGMNPDKLSPGERSASTSNRNFEGRQGKGGRTHLVSPHVAAATAVTGHLGRPRGPVTADRQEPDRWSRSSRTPAARCRCAAATSTPTRSSRPSTSSG